MTNAPIHQIAFMFVFNQDLAAQQVQIDIPDGNALLVGDGRVAQLQGYSSNATPPLLNFSVSAQRMFFNVSKASRYTGMQGIAWCSFTAGNPPTLQLDLQFSGALITATYNVIGSGTSGTFIPGRNTIRIGQ